MLHYIEKCFQKLEKPLTPYVGEAESLGLFGAVGLRVEIKPNTPPGGD